MNLVSEDNPSTKVPQEVIANILQNVLDDRDRAKTLWSCCLVSRIWYNTAIGFLYESPILNNKNFDKFAATMSSPVNSRMKRTGLERLVHRLDMGNLAYESTKSMTARLLRRVRANLKVFVAPAVSFSISCLAPLSKCSNLEILDLSRDTYDLQLWQLLKAIKKLPLKSLCLPRSAMSTHLGLEQDHINNGSWPATLKHLEIYDWMPTETKNCRELVESLPSSLNSICFEDCYSWYPFLLMYNGVIVAVNIEHLRIGLRREVESFPIAVVKSIFPNLITLALPASSPGVTEDIIPSLNLPVDGTKGKLRALSFRKIPGLVRFDPFLTTAMLLQQVRLNENLLKIYVPEGYLKVDDNNSVDGLEEIEKLISVRADKDEESGVYIY